MTLTVVLPTYNRCPDPRPDRNPLTWCLASLLNAGAEDIIVVDDRSTDHTPEVLAELADRSGGVIRTHQLPGHSGLGIARNTGFRLATGNQVLVFDDDCLAGPDLVRRITRAWEVARRLDPRTCALTLPYYTRARHPRARIAASEIGALHLDQGYFTTNFDCMPDGPQETDAPILRTSMVSGVCVFDRDFLASIGGYPDLSHWRTAYSDQLEVSAELAGLGWQVRHLADPRAAVIHLKYGARGSYQPLDPGDRDWPVPGVGHTLGELVALAERPRLDTGCRVADGAAMEEMIGSFFTCYAVHSRTGARSWAVRTYRDYVLDGRSYTAAYLPVPSRDDRRNHWRRGLSRGLRHALRRCDDTGAGRIHAQLGAACAELGEEPV